MVSVPLHGMPELGATAVTSSVTMYSLSVHTSITDSKDTSIQLSGASSGPGSKVPTGGDPNSSNTRRDPSSLKVMFKVTDSISSIPAPSLQILRTYSTSKKQECASTSPSSSASQAYPVNVRTGSPSTSPNSSLRTRSSSPSHDESIVNSSTELPSTRT
jgi:hypothetical protein